VSSSGIHNFFDWEHVTAMQTDNEDFGLLHQWISKCLISEQAYSAEEFVDQFGGTPKKDAAEEKPIERENVA
jgi:hypothetical protein